MAARTRVAFALFRQMYAAGGNDDPGFPARLWESLDQSRREPWLRQADVAIAAMQS